MKDKCSASAADDFVSPFRKRERTKVRDFLFLARSFIATGPIFSTPHASPLLDRRGEEMLAAREAGKTP